jgi:hypothetical protein
VGNTEIILSWTNPAGDADFAGVVISSAPAAGSLSTQKTINTADSPNNTYTVSGLSNGADYTIRIKAWYGNADFSDETVKIVRPASPVTDTSLDLLIAVPATGVSANNATTTVHNEFSEVKRAWK